LPSYSRVVLQCNVSSEVKYPVKYFTFILFKTLIHVFSLKSTMALGKALLLAAGLVPTLALAAPASYERQSNSTCKRTTVAIM
jgi:hypothetical protein